MKNLVLIQIVSAFLSSAASAQGDLPQLLSKCGLEKTHVEKLTSGMIKKLSTQLSANDFKPFSFYLYTPKELNWFPEEAIQNEGAKIKINVPFPDGLYAVEGSPCDVLRASNAREVIKLYSYDYDTRE